MTSPPDPRRRLTSDELIAVFVAFLSIGGIFFWATSQKDTDFQFVTLFPTNTASGSVIPAPTSGVTSTTPGTSSVAIAPNTGGVPAVVVPIDPNAPQTAQGFVPAPQIAAEPAPLVPSPNPALPNLVPAPTTPPSVPAKPTTGFTDVPNDFWAGAYIGELARRNILGGFQDGTYKPNEPITRAQFASIVDRAFDKPKVRQGLAFEDVPANYWARSSIDDAVQIGFMNGYPRGEFRPDQQIPLHQLQIALATGLNLQPQTPPEQTLAKYEDAKELPKWAQPKVAAAVESGLITGFPSPQRLTPNRIATRADAAALIYQALVKEGRITPAKG